MIELTNEQKQMFVCGDLDREDLDGFLSTLTLEQLKPYIESYNASVVQWVEFDADDTDTWPDEDGWYLSNLGLVWIIDLDGEVYVNTTTNPEDNESIFTTRWAYMPQPKEK